MRLVSSPLFNKNPDGSAVFLGSTFFITKNGLMLTAKHCLYDQDGNQTAKCPFIIQFLANNKYVLSSFFLSIHPQMLFFYLSNQ